MTGSQKKLENHWHFVSTLQIVFLIPVVELTALSRGAAQTKAGGGSDGGPDVILMRLRNPRDRDEGGSRG